MKQFTVYDGLFLILFYIKFSGQKPGLTWLEVFTPYFLQAFLTLAIAVWVMFGLTERVKFHFWNFLLKIKIRRAGDRARKYMKEQEEKGRRSANPGQFRDPSNYGK